MISRPDFEKKQILFVFPREGDKMSFSNDNIVIKDKDGKIKHQSTCYRLFMVFVVGDMTITTGLIKRAQRFGFTIHLMTSGMKGYQILGSHMEGNILLHKKQYEYHGLGLARHIIENKIDCQTAAIRSLRIKSEDASTRLGLLKKYREDLSSKKSLQELLGIEGIAARVYFREIFSTAEWKGRKPQIKPDYINSCLDIGYTILFNIIDSILGIYDFDKYCGVLHTSFYMRKSLVCDLMEPMRYMIDLQVRKSINYGQIKPEDFKEINHRYVLQWKQSPKYTRMMLEPILNKKEDIFLYIQDYYRSFMKDKEINEFPVFKM
ncbi:MAG: type V CRISPR-associated endonuclease Cas1 [Anaerovoracaceae bacterium]|jgi:CRISPR-associated protein Cas1